MKRLDCLALLLFFLMLGSAHAEVTIEGEKEYEPHSLVKLKITGVEPTAAVRIKIKPDDTVDRADTARDLIQFAAAPGTYEVEVLAIGQRDGAFYFDEDVVTVKIKSCHGPQPPPGPGPGPTPPPDGHGTLDPLNALGRIRFGNAGCTATVIGPRRLDGRWDILTAAHCVRGQGQKGEMTLRGRSDTFGITVVSSHPRQDICWCVTDTVHENLPYAMLASKNPEPGTPIWHAGYGVQNPGNREDGTVADRENGDGQLRMVLSVSSGDSGGGIFRSDTNEVISTVCCTSGKGSKVSMWGGSTEQCVKLRPSRVSEDSVGWVPIEIPTRPDPTGGNAADQFEWHPIEIPLRPFVPTFMHYLNQRED